MPAKGISLPTRCSPERPETKTPATDAAARRELRQEGSTPFLETHAVHSGAAGFSACQTCTGFAGGAALSCLPCENQEVMLKDVMLLWQAHSFADLPIPIMELIAMRQKEGIKSIFPLPAAGLRSLSSELFSLAPLPG